MDLAPGKRELARRRTLRTIRRAAMGLFLDHGFDPVTTTEVAEAAGVSPATLFNYFATKEDLFFGQVDELERRLVDVVRTCPPGASVLEALESHVLWELTAGRIETDPGAIAPFHRLVAGSPRLQAREHEIYDRREAVLAAALVDALGAGADAIHARVAARMYVAAEQLIAGELRHRLTRVSPARALRDIRPFTRAVFARLGGGVGPLPSAHPGD